MYDVILQKKFEDETKFNKNKSRSKYVESCKYDVFVGGEKDDDVKVMPNDLFWAMKHQFRWYFKGIQDGHSGNVNDYSLWIIATLAIVTIFTFICL
jgi:multicomponent Na+:H+ antiporter subunit D